MEDAAVGNVPIDTATIGPLDKGKDKVGHKKTHTTEVPPEAQKKKDTVEVPP